MENEKNIKFLCISCILISAVLADDSFHCGLTRCKRSGFDFCVRPPLVSTDDDSFCLSCETTEDKCGTSDQQAGCEAFCKEYLMLNWGCANNSLVTVKDYNPRNDKKICLDQWTVIVFSILFGCVVLSAVILLWQVGWIQAICSYVFYRAYKRINSKEIRPIPDIPPETMPLNNPNLNHDFFIQDETTAPKTISRANSSTTLNGTISDNKMKTTAGASSPKTETDTTSNDINKIKTTAGASSSTTVNCTISDNSNMMKTTAGASSSTTENGTTRNNSNKTSVSQEFKGPSNVSPTNHGDNLDKNFAIG